MEIRRLNPTVKQVAKGLRVSLGEGRKALRVMKELKQIRNEERKRLDSLRTVDQKYFDVSKDFHEQSETVIRNLEKSDRKLHDILFLSTHGEERPNLEYSRRLQAAIKPEKISCENEKGLRYGVDILSPGEYYPYSKWLEIREFKKEWDYGWTGASSKNLSAKLFRKMKGELPDRCPACKKAVNAGNAKKAKFSQGHQCGPRAGGGIQGYCYVCGKCGTILTEAMSSCWRS